MITGSNGSIRDWKFWARVIAVGTFIVVTAGLALQFGEIVVGVFTAGLQVSRPSLEGWAIYEDGTRDTRDALQIEMMDEFFRGVEEQHAAKPELPYTQIMNALLPITRSISPASVLINIALQNNSNQTANEVNIRTEWEREITDFSLSSVSKWEVLDGGIGQAWVLASIDRITVGEVVSMTVTYAPTQATVDTLELAVNHGPNAYTDNPLGQFIFESSDPHLPTFLIIPGPFTPAFESIRVRFSSNNTPLQEATLMSLTEARNPFTKP